MSPLLIDILSSLKLNLMNSAGGLNGARRSIRLRTHTHYLLLGYTRCVSTVRWRKFLQTQTRRQIEAAAADGRRSFRRPAEPTGTNKSSLGPSERWTSRRLCLSFHYYPSLALLRSLTGSENKRGLKLEGESVLNSSFGDLLAALRWRRLSARLLHESTENKVCGTSCVPSAVRTRLDFVSLNS